MNPNVLRTIWCPCNTSAESSFRLWQNSNTRNVNCFNKLAETGCLIRSEISAVGVFVSYRMCRSDYKCAQTLMWYICSFIDMKSQQRQLASETSIWLIQVCSILAVSKPESDMKTQQAINIPFILFFPPSNPTFLLFFYSPHLIKCLNRLSSQKFRPDGEQPASSLFAFW